MDKLISQGALSKLNVSQQELSDKFLLQLSKDFNACNAGVYFEQLSSPLEFDILLDEISTALAEIKKSGSATFQQLLYRIDVSEKQVVALLSQQTATTEYHLLSELIIKRILQKVILKIQFSKK